MSALTSGLCCSRSQIATLTLALLVHPPAVKIFYSLASPRFGTPSSSNKTPQLLPASTPTPDFLAVLDPSLAPSPNPPAQDSTQSSGATNYSCMARLSAPVWVQVLGGRRTADGEDAPQFGRVTLKTCLSAICISRYVVMLLFRVSH